jgi:hypothetical protein
MDGSGQSQIWAGCLFLGIGLGLILTYFFGWGIGLPVGVLFGLGGAFLIRALLHRRS